MLNTQTIADKAMHTWLHRYDPDTDGTKIDPATARWFNDVAADLTQRIEHMLCTDEEINDEGIDDAVLGEALGLRVSGHDDQLGDIIESDYIIEEIGYCFDINGIDSKTNIITNDRGFYELSK